MKVITAVWRVSSMIGGVVVVVVVVPQVPQVPAGIMVPGTGTRGTYGSISLLQYVWYHTCIFIHTSYPL